MQSICWKAVRRMRAQEIVPTYQSKCCHHLCGVLLDKKSNRESSKNITCWPRFNQAFLKPGWVVVINGSVTCTVIASGIWGRGPVAFPAVSYSSPKMQVLIRAEWTQSTLNFWVTGKLYSQPLVYKSRALAANPRGKPCPAPQSTLSTFGLEWSLHISEYILKKKEGPDHHSKYPSSENTQGSLDVS